MSLDTTRNHLMRMNLNMALATVAFAGGGFIGSMFGMNLESGLEHHPTMFYVMGTTMVTIGVMLISIYGTYYILRKKGIMKTSRKAVKNAFFENINTSTYTEKLMNIDTKKTV